MKAKTKNYGWICTKCGSVWAVWVDRCKKCEHKEDIEFPEYYVGTYPIGEATTINSGYLSTVL